MSSEMMIQCAGAFAAAFVIFHLSFWKLFRWKTELAKLTSLNRAVMQVLNLSLTIVFAIVAYLSLAHTRELLTTDLGRTFLALIATLWFLRAIQQIAFFGVQSVLSVLFLMIFIVGGTLNVLPLLDKKAIIFAEADWVRGGDYRLGMRVYSSETISDRPTVVVLLHGDSPFGNPSYQFELAMRYARNLDDVVVVGLMRPGYSDPWGNRSEGEKGLVTGDNWNATNTASLADATRRLGERWNARKLLLVGHSGGAALGMNILGRHPQVLDGAVLAANPCDVPRWRRHMLEELGREIFRQPVETLSPVEQIPGIRDGVPVTMVIGTEDVVTPLELSEECLAVALDHGKDVELIRLEGRNHGIFLEPEVEAALVLLID